MRNSEYLPMFENRVRTYMERLNEIHFIVFEWNRLDFLCIGTQRNSKLFSDVLHIIL